MTALKNLYLGVLFLFIAVVVLYPNPYGNNPDIIWDESYFLTSSLSAIENHTLPGWDFPVSGTYYGGPQTYLDTLVMIPALAVVTAFSNFSLTAAKVWVALNTGELLHVLRLVNGISALLSIAFLFYYFRRRQITRELGLTLGLFLFMLLSNVLVIEFLHTAKMWAFYIIFTGVASTFFIAQEYYASRRNEQFLGTKTYTALLIWSAILTGFQSYFGVFTIGLLILYALLLRHITISDILGHLRKYWLLIVAFAATQISFVYQAYKISAALADASTRLQDGSIDWYARLTKPLLFTIGGQPLSVLYIAALVALILFAVYKKSLFADTRRNLYMAIATAHPLLTYLIFQVWLGFDILPRYGIILSVSVCFSVTLLMSEFGRRAAVAALIASMALFFVIGAQAVQLYWSPSSETELVRIIKEKYNTPNNVFITDHSARRMTLPVNEQSLMLLDEKRRAMERFAFLLKNLNSLPPSDFKALTFTQYADETQADNIKRFASEGKSVWVITRSCERLCDEKELSAGTCFEVNTKACGVEPQEVNLLPVFLGAEQLGYSYIVRKVR